MRRPARPPHRRLRGTPVATASGNLPNDLPMTSDRPDVSPDNPPRRRRGLEGRVIGGRYEVTRTVAAGANTLIADATDRELDRLVTIKLVRPELSESEEFRRAFRAQMDVVSGVLHPNIGTVYDWGEERIGQRNTVYVVAEHLSGGSLRDLFDRRRRLTPSQALMIGLEACRGLDFAHRKGLVHTELTPSKLVFGDDRRLRIVDFGLAHLLGETAWRERDQLATHVARYASPEQAQGLDVDGKTDVYSLALIMAEAVSGLVPFMADSTVATLNARIGKLMPVSADLGPLAAVLERAGRPEPAERASASQFGRALVRAAQNMPRPTPIEGLSTGLFINDPSTMRRPNDPTGGLVRPPDAPQPALVPTGDRSVDPHDTTAEITAGDDATKPIVPDEVATELAAATTAAAGRTGAVQVPTPTPPSDGAQPTPDDGSAVSVGATGSSPEPRANDDLAALVERTPRGAAPAEPLAVLPATRRGRRQARKSAKRGAKANAKAGVASPPNVPATTSGPAAGAAVGRRRRWVPWVLGPLMLATIAGLGVLAYQLFQKPTHEVPEVVGMNRDEALTFVEGNNWEIDFEDARSDDFPDPGAVIRTSPPAGADLAEGSPLLLVVSQGPEYRQVPDVSGMTLDDALARVTELKLDALEPTEAFSESVPAGSVISAAVDGVPTGGDVLPGAQMAIVVSQGPQPRDVPQLQGLTSEQATQLLTDRGLVLSLAEPVFDDTIPAGQIVSQTPAASEQAPRGATITATPSKGPDLVALPDLTGLTLPEIRPVLEANGLNVGSLLGSTAGTFVSASVDGDEVTAGSMVIRGSEVNLIIL
ncbi:hypothetical protein BH24ACT5_BH24ACT5_02210 [soil metagenome]